MKILHVVASLAPESGGPAKACIEMARAVARRGHEVAIFTLDRGLGPEAPDLQRAIEGVELRLFPEQWPHAFATSWPLARALARELRRFDVVHLHSLYLFHDWATARACRRHRVPYILRPHGTLDPYIHRRKRWRKLVIERLFQDRVTRGAARLHYTAEEEERISEPFAHGTPGAVVPLGLDPGDYAALPPRGSFRARHPELGERRLVLFMGRLHEKKGLDLLARAFGHAVRRGLDAHLVIAGPDDGMAAPLSRWLAEEGVLERASLTGMVSGDEKLALLADADLFVLASHSENFGIAVIEALLCGVPVLISDRVNLWREVETAGCGRAAPLDIPRIAARLEEMLGDPAGLAAMGARGRALVLERFAWPRVAEVLERLYGEVAAEARFLRHVP